MRVLFLILLALPALAAQPFAGAERPISPYRDAPRLGMKYSAVAAGGVGGFFAAWGEANDGFRVYGAYLTGDGKPATRPFLLGESYPTDLRVRSKGAGYVVTTDVPGFAWEVGPGYLIPVDSSPEPPVENASGEHLVITSEAGQFTVTFVDRNGQMHGPPIRTKELVSPSTVLHVLPAGDDWLLLVRGWNDSVQWTRLNHSGFAGSSVVLPVMPSTAYAGSRSFSELAVNGSSVSFAWTQSLKLDNVPNPEWERTLGYTVVDMQNGSSGETRIDSTRMRMGVYDSRTPTGGRPAALFDGREFVYAWTWLRYPGEAELRVVNGHGAPRVMAQHRDAFPYDFMPALAAGPDRDLVLWHPHSYIYDRFDRHDVLARAFDATSSIDDGVAATLVTAGVTTQRMLRQAMGPNGSFAVWSEMGDENVIRGRFIPASSNGGDAVTLFDAEGVPSVAASADTFLVAVREYVRKPPYNTRLMLRRFDRNGVAVDAQPVVFSNGYLNYGNAISILPDGDSFVLAWSYNTSAFALRVPSRGAIASTPVRITTTKNVAEPHLARVAGRAVVVWISMTPDSGSFTIQGARLRDTLELEPPSDLWLMYTRANAGQGVLSVEGNDRELMVGAGSSPFGETATASACGGSAPTCARSKSPRFSAARSPRRCTTPATPFRAWPGTASGGGLSMPAARTRSAPSRSSRSTGTESRRRR